MRAYEPYKLFKPKHPLDFAKIKHYLIINGKLHLNDEALEDKYFDFSDTKGTTWLAPYQHNLEEFAMYLYNIELDDTPEDPEIITPEVIEDSSTDTDDTDDGYAGDGINDPGNLGE